MKREQYIGTWLPEPLVIESADVADCAELAESLSFAFLMLLECLSPTERAVFLLREVFDYGYETIANIVDKSVPNCRQIIRRARQHLVLRRPIAIPQTEQQELLEQFLSSWNRGDIHSLIALMAEDVTFWGDGGGEVVAIQRPIQGHFKVARFLVAIQRSKLVPTLISQDSLINGQPGLVNYADGALHSVFTFNVRAAKVSSIFAVANPTKLRQIENKQKRSHRPD